MQLIGDLSSAMVAEPYVVSQSWTDVVKNTARIYVRYFKIIICIFFPFLYPFWIFWDTYVSTLPLSRMGPFAMVSGTLVIFATGVLTAAIHDVCVGNTPTVYHSFAVAGRRFSRLFGVALLESFAIIFGLLLLIIPGIVLSIWFLFSASIVIVEDVPVWEALKRSYHLVKGEFWKCLIIYGGFYLFQAGVMLVMTILVQDEVATLAQALITNVFILLAFPLPQIAAVLLYYDLRSRKENLDIRPLFKP